MSYYDRDETRQTHTHEYLGSTELAPQGQRRHNHRFAGVTGEAIPYRGSHIHKLFTKTSFDLEHFHTICDTTGPAINIGKGRHIHVACGVTSEDLDHVHKYFFGTLKAPNPPYEYRECGEEAEYDYADEYDREYDENPWYRFRKMDKHDDQGSCYPPKNRKPRCYTPFFFNRRGIGKGCCQ